MAVLTDARRVECHARYMSDLSAEFDLTTTLTKADIRAAVDALDTYLNANAAAINAALPQPARTVLSTTQKARLLTTVVSFRYLDGV